MAKDNLKEANESKKDQDKNEKSKPELKKEKSLEDKFVESEDKLLRSLAEIENDGHPTDDRVAAIYDAIK